jgi:hypothetical protein
MGNSEPRTQVVYAIGSPQHSLVKIGTTANLPARLASLQTSSPFRLQVFWRHEGGRELERHLHAELKERRLHGEWFDFEGADLIALVSEAAARPIRQPAPAPVFQPATGLPEGSALGTLLAELKAVEDPAERGALATEVLGFIAEELNPELSRMRYDIAHRLRAQGLTYKQIGEHFGPEGAPLHFSRIQQILKGGATGKWARLGREDSARSDASRPEGE